MDVFFRRAWILIAIGVGALAVWWAREALLSVCMLMLGGLTMAYLCSPIALFLERRRVHGGVAALLAILTALIVIALFLLLAVPVFYRQAQTLLLSLPRYLGVLQTLAAEASDLLLERGLIHSPLELDIRTPTQQITQNIVAWSGTFMRVVPGGIARSVLTPVIAFYFIKDRKWFIDRILHIVPQGRRHIAVNAGRAMREVLKHYIGGQCTVALITGLLTGIAMMIMGIEGFVVLGVLMAVCDLIPVLGPWLGAVPAMAIAAGHGWWIFLAAGLAIFLIQQIENSLLSPRIVGSSAGLHPVVVICSLILGGGLLGVAGMFFSIPFLLMARSVVRAIRQDRLYSQGAGKT